METTNATTTTTEQAKQAATETKNASKTAKAAAKVAAKAAAKAAKADEQAAALAALMAEAQAIEAEEAASPGDPQETTIIDDPEGTRKPGCPIICSAPQAFAAAAKAEARATAAKAVAGQACKIGLKSINSDIKTQAADVRDYARLLEDFYSYCAKSMRMQAASIERNRAAARADFARAAARSRKGDAREMRNAISDLAAYERTLKGYIESLISGFLSARANGEDASEDDAKKASIFCKLLRSLETSYNEDIKPRAAAKYFARVIAERYPYKTADGTLLKLTARGAKAEVKVITTRHTGTTYTATRKLQHVIAVPATASEIVKVYYSVALAGANVAPATLIASDPSDKGKKPTYYLANEAAKFDTCEIFTNFEIASAAMAEKIENAELLKKQARIIDKASALGLKFYEAPAAADAE